MKPLRVTDLAQFAECPRRLLFIHGRLKENGVSVDPEVARLARELEADAESRMRRGKRLHEAEERTSVRASGAWRIGAVMLLAGVLLWLLLSFF